MNTKIINRSPKKQIAIDSAHNAGCSEESFRKNPALLDLNRIKLDPTLQCRAALDQPTIDEYEQRMKAGDKFPPLVVFEIDKHYFLADGWHRYPAAQKAGLRLFPVEIRPHPAKPRRRLLRRSCLGFLLLN